MEGRSRIRGAQRPLDLEELLIHRVLDKALINDGNLGDRVALLESDGAHQITYKELNSKANKLAARLVHLVEDKEEQFDKIVAVCLHPSIDMIVSLLAIFKSGAAYLPIEPSFPADRVSHILQDSKPAVLISSSSVLQSSSFASVVETSSVHVYDLDLKESLEEEEERSVELAADGKILAVVLYTSGSTGIPKGVRLQHRTILHRLSWQWNTFPYSADEVGCFKTALTFVDSIAEIWAPLLIGVPVHIVPKAVTQDTQRFIDLLDRCEISRLVLVPSLLKAILTLLKSEPERDSTPLKRLKIWVCSGEILTSQLLLEFYDVFPAGTIMCNYYGSTEVMGDVTYAVFDSKEQVLDALVDNKVPIGKIIDNCAIYLLGYENEVVEIGDIGEVYVAGSHLCSGYVNNREMDRFILNLIDKDEPGYEVMFRTGDYGRLVNGQLYFEGRADSQVKIRGHRVDLNEVSNVINRLRQVSFGGVLCYKAGEPEQEVVAFISPTPGSTIEEIKEILKGKLISYMMPKILEINDIPLLVNGKVDRQKLLRLFVDQQRQTEVGPLWNESQLNPAERALLKTVLSVAGDAGGGRPIRLTDNFFDIGGNSLNAVAVVTKLRDQGFNLDMTTFLSASKLEELVPKLSCKSTAIPSIQELGSNYVVEMLTPSSKEDVIRIISTSFSEKAELELLTHVIYEDYDDFMHEIWDPLLDANLSFVLKDEKGKIVAVSLNFDVFDEPPVEPKVKRLSYIFEFLESIESRVREKHFENKKHNLIHSFMMATIDSSTPAQNVALIQRMEIENMNLARERGFSGIFTTNTNELTRQVCDDLLDYQVLFEYQINQFVASDGTRPFADARDTQYSTVTVKYIN